MRPGAHQGPDRRVTLDENTQFGVEGSGHQVTPNNSGPARPVRNEFPRSAVRVDVRVTGQREVQATLNLFASEGS